MRQGIGRGTGIANFRPNPPADPADLVVTATGPSTVTAGQNATYTLTISNAGPNSAKGVVLTDVLPAGASLVSITKSSGSDLFNFAQSGATITGSAAAPLASGSSDSFQLVVTASANSYDGAAFNNTASISSDGSTSDPNSANNSVTVSGSITGGQISGDVAISQTSNTSSVAEGATITYSLAVVNNDLDIPRVDGRVGLRPARQVFAVEQSFHSGGFGRGRYRFGGGE